jgi:hypothetical protein
VSSGKIGFLQYFPSFFPESQISAQKQDTRAILLKTTLIRVSCVQNTQIRGETTTKVFGKVDTFWTYQCSSYLPLGVPNWVPNMHYQPIFLAPLPGRKRISARGVSRFQSFTLLLFCFTLFLLASFIKKKLVPFIVGFSLLLLLVHFVVP